MSQINFSFNLHAQDGDCDLTPLVAASSLMSHTTTASNINKNTTNSSSSSYTLTTHSIKANNNNNDNGDHNNSNIDTAVYKRSFNNPALVKRKQYSKSYKLLRVMKDCNNLLLGIAIASLSVVFYIIGAIFFAVQLVQLKANLYDSIILETIFLITCLVMSVASSLLIFGIVKQRHIMMIPWIILTFIGIICDILYLIVLYTSSKEYRLMELVIYLVGIGLQTFIFMNMYRLYKSLKWKFIIQQEHKVIWETHQDVMENQ